MEYILRVVKNPVALEDEVIPVLFANCGRRNSDFVFMEGSATIFTAKTYKNVTIGTMC